MARHRAHSSIALVGFMGAGKTTVGRALSERLAMSFVDTDREIEQAVGLKVADIFAERGETAFRAAEFELICRLIENQGQVLSLGGGAFVDPRTREAVNRSATSVWLDPPFELVAERIARSAARPLASGSNPEELRRLWEERRPSYAEAHTRIAPAGGDPDETVDQILAALK